MAAGELAPLEQYLKMHPGAQPGPCIGCGAENYPLSMGGPAICPQCDCQPPEHRVRHLAAENRRLRQRIAELEARSGATLP
jgi:hypothetical protein